MSVGISNSDLRDLTLTTLQNLPDNQFEVAFKYADYVVVNQWFQSDKVQEDGGTYIQRNIVLDTSGNAKHVRLYQKTPINTADVQLTITAPWCQLQTHWSMERREMLRNRGKAQFIKLVNSKRIDCMVDLANLLEERAFATPTSSSDELLPRGIPYWITKCPANGTSAQYPGGFVGQTVRFGDGSTSTNKGGIDTAAGANTRWLNYGAVYDAVNGDFVKRLRRAFHATNFKSPMLAKDLKEGPAAKYRLYMGLDTLNEYEDLATKQNDNNGPDLDPFHGNTTFKRVPIFYMPVLDADTDAPVYGVNHSKFFPIVLSGDWLRENEPMFDVEQHNVMTTFVDSSYQYFCTNVRAGGFVMHKKTTT